MSSATETTNSSNANQILSGYCYCGEVKYEVDTKQDPIFPPCYCHCEDCRRAHAAPLYQVACIDMNTEWKIVQGSDRIQKYSRPNAKNGITRCFCNQCGTKLFNEFDIKEDWAPKDKKIMVFFPDTSTKEDRAKLPYSYQPKSHNRSQDCVLDMKLLSNLNIKDTAGYADHSKVDGDNSSADR